MILIGQEQIHPGRSIAEYGPRQAQQITASRPKPARQGIRAAGDLAIESSPADTAKEAGMALGLGRHLQCRCQTRRFERSDDSQVDAANLGVLASGKLAPGLERILGLPDFQRPGKVVPSSSTNGLR
jgi:hypothetical protein